MSKLEQRTITFGPPLRRSWQRAQQILFHPASLEIWLVLGFAGFLAGLADGHAGLGPGINFSVSSRLGEYSWDVSGLSDLLAGSLLIMLFLPIIVLCMIVFAALLWVGSRGKFVFLDGVAHRRAAIVEPWNRYARQGNSLFLWRLGFYGVCLLAGGTLAAPMIMIWGGRGSADEWSFPAVLLTLIVILTGIFLGIVSGYVWLLLEHFVVPVMYHQQLTANAAWGRLLPLIRRRWSDFLLYGIFIVLLLVGLAFCYIAVSIASCCVIPFILWWPYISSVVLLPITVTYRALGPEFLAQFGDEFEIFNHAMEASPSTSGPLEIDHHTDDEERQD